MTKRKILRLSFAVIILIIGGYLIASSGIIKNFTNKEPDFSQYYSGNYKDAYEKLLLAAKNGDAIAQVNLANMYKRGLRV